MQARESNSCSHSCDQVDFNSILVCGIGSPWGDDQLGWLTAQQIQAAQCSGLRVQLCIKPVDILDHLNDIAELHLIDACRVLHDSLGVFHRLCWPSDILLAYDWSTTHDFNLLAALELAQALNKLPKSVVVWAIEAGGREATEDGVEDPVKQPAARSIRESVAKSVAAAILDELVRSRVN